MPPKKNEAQDNANFNFLDLPQTLQWRIAQFLSGSTQHPMAAVCTGMFDVFVEHSLNVCLKLGNPSTAINVMRKVCEQGPHGKSLTIRENGLFMDEEAWVFALPDMLQPSRQLRTAGWTRIKQLSLVMDTTLPKDTDVNLDILGPTFPEMQIMELKNVPLYNGGLFSGLKGCKSLWSISLNSCTVLDEEACAVKLATLPSIESLFLTDTPFAILNDLSSSTLTELTIYSREHGHSTYNEIQAVAINNKNLHTLFADSNCDSSMLTFRRWQALMEQCSVLKILHLQHADLYHREVMTLVQMGTHIKSVTVSSLQLTGAVVPRPSCNWQVLRLCSDTYPHILTLANLPIAALQHLTLLGAPQVGPMTWETLTLPGNQVPPHELPIIVRKAATVLAGTASWKAAISKQQAGLNIRVPSDPFVSRPHLTALLTTDLMAALAPLSKTPPNGIQLLGFSDSQFTVGGPQLEALHTALGATVSMTGLDGVFLLPSFYPALSRNFPGLKKLRLGQLTDGAIGTEQLALFCRAASHSIVVELSNEVCHKEAREQLQKTLSVWGGSSAVLHEADNFFK